MARQRPAAVTVIGWFWRFGGVVGMVFALPIALEGENWFGRYWAVSLSPTLLFCWAFLSSFIGLLIGNGILNGRSRARILLIAYCLLGTLVGAVLYQPHPLIWFNSLANLLFTAGMWFFLYRPEAKAFFESGTV